MCIDPPKNGKMSDYTDTLTKGRRISYWWSDEDGWLKGNISKSLYKVTGALTICWKIKVDFDNGDRHLLEFEPSEKRWKVFHSNKKTEAKEEEPKNKAAKKPAAKKSVKSVGEKKAQKVSKKSKSDKKVVGMVEKAKPAKKSVSAAPQKPKKQSTLSFGANLQSKIQEVSSRMHTASASAAAAASKRSLEGELVNYSPNSIIAVKAAHAKLPTAILSTQSIGHSDKSPPGVLSPTQEEGRKVSHDIEKKRIRDRSLQVSLISPPSPSGNTEQASAKHAKSVKTSGNSGNPTVMQSLYKKECGKADDFVDYMTASSKSNAKEPSAAAAASSPESKDDSDLELKLDNG